MVYIFSHDIYEMINKLWLGICIVCIIILSVVVSLVILYGSDVFDYANESYNDRAMLALFGLGLLSAIGVYATYGKISPKQESQQDAPVDTSNSLKNADRVAEATGQNLPPPPSLVVPTSSPPQSERPSDINQFPPPPHVKPLPLIPK
jgi:hypothetical protein